ncbi:MAG: hypothetical protein KDJ73_10685 [Notoacmeibacter sp.]|nr:hypothetical protein [Notoacmeibacter sp.]MCC0032937.1 hypothetical protein [Brucellaceae bacterium]
MSEKISVALIGIAGAGLAAWLGAIQVQVNDQAKSIADIKKENNQIKSGQALDIEKIKQCERLGLQIINEEEANDIGGERIATDLFEKMGCDLTKK